MQQSATPSEYRIRLLVETTTLPLRVIAARVGMPRSTLSMLKARRGWVRPLPARVALEGRRGGGHPIVPEVVAAARLLVEGMGERAPDGSPLSFKAIAARTGVSATTLCRWRKRSGWARPKPEPRGWSSVRAPLRPPRNRRGRGRPYAADAIGRVRTLLTTTLLTQAAIARQVGVSQAQVSEWLRRRGWERPAVRPGSRRFAAAARRGALASEGDRRGRPYAPELRREARSLYELSRLPTAFIGARLGVHRVTVARWAKEDAWERPRDRIGRRR